MVELTGGLDSLGWTALKALLMFALTVAGLRITERRTLAQLGAFDFAVAVALGALIARTATSSTTSVATGAVALLTLLVAHRMITEFRRRFGSFGLTVVPPRVLIADGQLQRGELARAGLTSGDVLALLRERGVAETGDVRFLLYEARGAVTLVYAGQPVGETVREGLRTAGFLHGDESTGRGERHAH